MQVKPSDIREFFRNRKDYTGKDLAEGDMASTELADHLSAATEDARGMVASRARNIMTFTAKLRQKLDDNAVSSSEVADATKVIDIIAVEILKIVSGE